MCSDCNLGLYSVAFAIPCAMECCKITTLEQFTSNVLFIKQFSKLKIGVKFPFLKALGFFYFSQDENKHVLIGGNCFGITLVSLSYY